MLKKHEGSFNIKNIKGRSSFFGNFLERINLNKFPITGNESANTNYLLDRANTIKKLELKEIKVRNHNADV
jgi:hypothetical protein